MHQLETLVVHSPHLRTLAPLVNLTALKQLDCTQSSVDDAMLSAYQFDSVESLEVNGTRIRSYAWVTNFRRLKRFWGDISLPCLEDQPSVQSFNQLLHLECLIAKNVKPKHIPALTGLKTLSVELEDQTDLQILSTFRELTSLGVDTNATNEYGFLAALPSLEILHLKGTSITDLSVLTHLPKLKCLYLDNTAVTDLTPLQTLTTLEEVHLSETPITNIDALSQLPQLRVVSLPRSVSSLQPIVETIYQKAQDEQHYTLGHDVYVLAWESGLDAQSRAFLKTLDALRLARL